MGNADARHQSRPLPPLTRGTSLGVSPEEFGIYLLNRSSTLRKRPAGTRMEIHSSHSFLHFRAKEERNLLRVTVPVLPPPLCALTLVPSN